MDEQKIDVNKASLEILEKLKGVGRSKAEAIINTREGLGIFRSIEEILKVPGIGRSLLELNRDTLMCSFPSSQQVHQANPLRRSLRRSIITVNEHLELNKIMKTSDRDNYKNGRDSVSEGDSSSSGRRRDKDSVVVRGAKLIQVDEDIKEDELMGLEFVEDGEEEEEEEEEDEEDDDDSGGSTQCSGELKDIVLAIHRNNNITPSDRGHFRSDSNIGSGLGSDTPHEEGNSGCGLGGDTPHEEGVSDTPLDVPLSPMRLTDGELEMENDDEEIDEDLENKMVFEEEMMAVDQVAKHLPDKKQIKRKSDMCSDSKGTCPVKKTCKAVDTSDCCERLKPTSNIGHKFSPPSGLKSWLSKYQNWTQSQKLCALDSLIDVCDLSQVRHIHQTILPQFQRDFISLLPKELALYVLSFLEPKDLLRAAQTCKYWNILAADNLLWREKCRESGLEDHLFVLNQRRKKGTSVSHMSPFKAAYMRQHRIEMNWRVNPLKGPRVLKGHDDHVITCLQFSGNTVVSGSDDNTLKVWDATTGKCMRTLSGHTGGVWSSQMSDNLIVSGSTDRMLRVWNATTGDCIHTLYGHTSTVRCLHLHGKTVVSGSRDATLRVWNINTGSCEHVLVGHVAAVRCVQFNGKLVVSGAYDYMVKVWDPVNEECLHTLQGHTNRVYSLQFDGVHVVSGSLDTSIRVWDVDTGHCKHTLMGHQSLTSGMELKNNILISGNADSTVKVWDILTGQCLQTLSGPHKHRSAVTCLQFNNKFVVTSSDDGTVKLWDVKTGEFIRNLVALDSGGSGGVVWRIRASDTKLVCAVGSRNGTEETKLMVLDFDVYETNNQSK